MNLRLPIAFLFALSLLAAPLVSRSQTVVVKPREIQDVLINPGMGFTTFHRFNSDHLKVEAARVESTIEQLVEPNGDLKFVPYPPSSLAYFRWYWDEIEPEQGRYRWDLIDGVLKEARSNGQKLAFRLMPQNGEPRAPEWYRKLAPGFEYEDGKSWMPDYESPLFAEHFGRLVADLGERYDGHPDVDHVDIGILGRWGEWHTSETGHPMPSADTQISFVDLYLAAFTKTPLVMLIGGEEALAHAVRRGAGWRADCLGDMGGFSKNWNHMEDMYPLALARAEAGDAWQRSHVAFESCWTLQHWVDQGWDVKEILDRALQYHVSVFNNKSSAIPESCWGLVNDFLRKMGYRFVVRRLAFPESVRPGHSLSIEVLWENVGVAPCYHPFLPAYQIKKDESVILHSSETDIRSWLPGYRLIQESIPVPADCPPGTYTLRVALLDPRTRTPAVRLATEGRDPDGWYTLGQLQVQP